jgi:hypothetical protein
VVSTAIPKGLWRPVASVVGGVRQTPAAQPPPWQSPAQAPQWAGSSESLDSQPLPPYPSQSPNPGLQALTH